MTARVLRAGRLFHKSVVERIWSLYVLQQSNAKLVGSDPLAVGLCSKRAVRILKLPGPRLRKESKLKASFTEIQSLSKGPLISKKRRGGGPKKNPSLSKKLSADMVRCWISSKQLWADLGQGNKSQERLDTWGESTFITKTQLSQIKSSHFSWRCFSKEQWELVLRRNELTACF